MKNVITTDFHAHVLPGADHGSDGLEMSLNQLSLIASHGIKRVVATPHFYPMRDNVDLFIERRTDSAGELKRSMTPGLPAVMIGAEVLVCEGMERMEGLDRLTVYGTDCILLEMPTVKWTDGILDTVWEISKSGLVPVMAHIDRYDPKYVEQLLALGVKAQLNPNAFMERKMRKQAEKWLEEGHIVALGSDLHRVNAKEYKAFIRATQSLGTHGQEIEASMKDLLDGAKQIVAK